MNLVYKHLGNVQRVEKSTHTRLQNNDYLAQASQARAGSPVFDKGLARNLTLPPNDSYDIYDLQQETDDFIEQCLHEYITWLAQTEVRRSQLTLSTIESFKPTDWSAFEHKEATTD